MIKKTACVILILMTIMLEGCWNNRDITDLAIITGIGIDKAADGNIELTFQVISTEKHFGGQSGGSSQGSGDGGGSQTVNVSSEGPTIFDAARNVIPKLSKKAYYSHIQLLVISDEAAREGLDKVWDFFERDHEVNRLFRVIVVKGGTAKSILSATACVESIGAVEIANTIDNEAFGKSVRMQAFKVTELLSQPLTGLVTGVIVPNGSDKLTDMQVEGGAVFKNARLEGYLSNDQTRGYLFASNQIKSTILTIANPEEADKLVSLEVISSVGNLTAGLKNGRPELGIDVTAYGNIGEEQGDYDLTDLNDIKTLENEAETLIADNIRGMATVSQKMLDSDILNFNDILYKHDYNDFEKIKGQWNELYRDSEISINVHFCIKRTGITKKPAYTN
jgi:spore germination protein KC